jgi:putative sigma-54 modulation protein
MKIKFSSKDLVVPNRVHDYAEQQVGELEPLFQGRPEALMVFGAEGEKVSVELTIYAGTTIFRVLETAADMMVAVDAAVATIRYQMRTNRARLRDNILANAFEENSDELTFIPERDRFNEPTYRVVRSKAFDFGLMPVEEAILQMNLVGHDFFAFRNEDKDGAFSVVYRRRNGGYGVLTDKG